MIYFVLGTMRINDGSGTWAAFGGTYIWSEDFSQLEYVGQIPNSTLGPWGRVRSQQEAMTLAMSPSGGTTTYLVLVR